MRRPTTREYTPHPVQSGDWFSIDWGASSDVIDVFLHVNHSHADKSYTGKGTVEHVHMMLNLDELLQMEKVIHREIVKRLKDKSAAPRRPSV